MAMSRYDFTEDELRQFTRAWPPPGSGFALSPTGWQNHQEYIRDWLTSRDAVAADPQEALGKPVHECWAELLYQRWGDDDPPADWTDWDVNVELARLRHRTDQ